MDLKAVINTVPDFPKPGIMFLDIMPILANPSALASVVSKIADEWRGKVDGIVALESRGFFFGAPVAMALGLPLVPARKKGKLPGEIISITYKLEYGVDTIEIQKGVLAPGMRVLVLDDLLATGGTALAACALVESAGATVAGCAFVIEVKGLGGRKKLSGRTITSLVRYGGESEVIECVDVIARLDDEFVVVERFTTPVGLAFPGGKVDSGETFEEAIVREFFEETGLSLAIEGSVGVYDAEGRDPRGAYVSTVFHGRAVGEVKAEVGKTRVLLLSRNEIESRRTEFIADHFTMFSDYVKQNCS